MILAYTLDMPLAINLNCSVETLLYELSIV